MLTKVQKKTRLARQGEAYAARFYTARGATILGANISFAVGELDLVVRERDGTIVFVEVKTRSTAQYGVGETVTVRKFARMRKAASQWLANRASLADVRFDVIALTVRPRGASPVDSTGEYGSDFDVDFDVDYFQGIEHGAG